VFESVKSMSFKPKIFQYTNELNPAPGTSLAKCNPVSLSNYIYSTDCILCGEKRSPNMFANKLNFQRAEKKLVNLIKVCQLCASNRSYNMGLKNDCISMDCQNNFLLLNAKQEYQKTNHVRDIIDEYF
jgi:biotin synthase-related radical SAM superfamily protein